jgi:nucleotide-binding universal stress UspA family protein
MFEKILLCLDGSTLAEQILPYAIAEAECFRSKVTLLRVVTTEIPAAARADPQIIGEKMDEISKKEKEDAAYLKRIARRLRAKGIDVQYIVENGNAGEIIVDYAKKNGIGLIAMATHSHSGMGRIIFGSVAEYVVRESGLPVLMIKPE